MMEAYQSGDPYLKFAKMAGAVPENATKQTHPAGEGSLQGMHVGGAIWDEEHRRLARAVGQDPARRESAAAMPTGTHSQTTGGGTVES